MRPVPVLKLTLPVSRIFTWRATLEFSLLGKDIEWIPKLFSVWSHFPCWFCLPPVHLDPMNLSTRQTKKARQMVFWQVSGMASSRRLHLSSRCSTRTFTFTKCITMAGGTTSVISWDCWSPSAAAAVEPAEARSTKPVIRKNLPEGRFFLKRVRKGGNQLSFWSCHISLAHSDNVFTAFGSNRHTNLELQPNSTLDWLYDNWLKE